jgi:hypothetical protein
VTDTDAGPRLGRRDLLAGAGAATLAGLAGCGRGLLEDPPPTIARDDLRAAIDGDPPTVPETLPVAIEASFVDAQRAGARSKLDATPAPFDSGEIPNGVIRERLNDDYDGALRSLRDSRDAPTPYERLGHAGRARTGAREVQAAWAAIAGELTISDLRESITTVRGDVDAVADEHAYVGDDPVRAAVVHDELEGRIDGARRWLSVSDRAFAAAAESSLGMAEVARDIERARVDVAEASYLFERFRTSLGSATDLRERLVDAAATLTDRIDARADAVPAERPDDPTSLVDRDVGPTAGVQALERLAVDARARIRNRPDDSGPANGVVNGAWVLTTVRAFERLRDRIEGGDDVAVETAGDVAALRSDAIAAVEAAADVERGQAVADALRHTFASDIRWTDRRLDGGSDDIRVDSVARDAAGYVRVAAVCLALPPVVGDVAGVLRESA